MSVPTQGWTRLRFIYTDDFGVNFAVLLNDYIGEAGCLEPYDQRQHQDQDIYKMGEPHLRHLRVRSFTADADGKKDYKDIPVQETNPLWTGPLGQHLYVAGQVMEVVRKVEEIEYGRKGRAAERRALRQAKNFLPNRQKADYFLSGHIRPEMQRLDEELKHSKATRENSPKKS